MRACSSGPSAGLLAATSARARALGLIKQRGQLDQAALPSAKWPPARAEHGAEGHVLQAQIVRLEAGRRGDGEQLPEMQGLAIVGEIQDALGAQGFGPVADGGQIRGRVQIAAIGLAHDHRPLAIPAGGALGQEHALGAVGFGQQTPRVQSGQHGIQRFVVGAFRPDVIRGEADAQAVVNLLAVGKGNLYETPPAGSGSRVAGLQRHHHGAAGLGKGGVCIEAGLCGPIELFQIRQRLGILTDFLEVGEQHAELSAPIADMVLPEHQMPQGFQDADHGIADDGAAQMPDMHLLGEIRAGIVHHHPLGRDDRRDQGRLQIQLGAEEGVLQTNVEEAGAGRLQLRAIRQAAICGKGREHLIGQFAGVPSLALGGGHDPVRLIMAELRAGGRAHQSLRRGAAALGERRLNALRKQALGVHGAGATRRCIPAIGAAAD